MAKSKKKQHPAPSRLSSASGSRFPLSPAIATKRTRVNHTQSSITKSRGVCGGDACVSGTRIPVWVLERSRQLGISIDDILEDYPSISWKQLLAAWQYAEEHRAEIEKQIRENEGD